MRSAQAPELRKKSRVGLLILGGLLVQVVGLLVDGAYHREHLSFAPESPKVLVRVHSLIYVGILIVVVAGIRGLVSLRAGGKRAQVWALATSVIGAVAQVVGVIADLRAHALGNDVELWHDMVYFGALVTFLGGLALVALWQLGPRAGEGLTVGRLPGRESREDEEALERRRAPG